MLSVAPGSVKGKAISLKSLKTLEKGSITAGNDVANTTLARALRATAEAERRGAAPSGTNVHKIGNKIVVGAISNNSTKKLTTKFKWIENRPGHWVRANPSSELARLEQGNAQEQPQAVLQPLDVPLGAFPVPRGAEPSSPLARAPRRRKYRTRKTRRYR